MGLTYQDCQKIGDALAVQLASTLGMEKPYEQTTARLTAEPWANANPTPSLSSIEGDLKAVVVPAVQKMLRDLKAGGHYAGAGQGDAVIIIA